MEIICNPRHPVAKVVGSSKETQPVPAGGLSAEIETGGPTGHDPEHCAICLIAVGAATDITNSHIEPVTGRLIG
jgi:hypothetical protein